ncbi:fatty-acyl-CoA synthase, partial [Mytilus galloprovincialis]
LIIADRFQGTRLCALFFISSKNMAVMAKNRTQAELDTDKLLIAKMLSKFLVGQLKDTYGAIMENISIKNLIEVWSWHTRTSLELNFNVQFLVGQLKDTYGCGNSRYIEDPLVAFGCCLLYGRETRICIPVPLYHCFGMVIGSLQMVTNGSTCVFPSPAFESGATLHSVSKERCTSLYGVPTMFIDMLNHHDFDKFDLKSLYTGVMAGSPCPIETMRQVISQMNMPSVTVCYGTTENSPVTFQSYRDDVLEKKVSTVGRSHPHIETKIVDENGDILPVGESGELCTRGYMTMLEYWNDPTKTKEVIKSDRWYFTGDIGEMDEDGFCRIVGRIKDMIIRGGENVYPLELEQILYKHPDVKDVQVVGIPDDRLGEEIFAFIQIKDDHSCSEEDIIKYCKEKMARYKIPRFVKFVKEFPLTVTGKVQKFKLQEIAELDLQS